VCVFGTKTDDRAGDEFVVKPGPGQNNIRQNQCLRWSPTKESGESVGEKYRRDPTYEAWLQYSLFCVSVSATCYVETARWTRDRLSRLVPLWCSLIYHEKRRGAVFEITQQDEFIYDHLQR
jgi:hypothetical protein